MTMRAPNCTGTLRDGVAGQLVGHQLHGGEHGKNPGRENIAHEGERRGGYPMCREAGGEGGCGRRRHGAQPGDDADQQGKQKQDMRFVHVISFR